MTFQTIMVPTDYSLGAEHALDLALKFAETYRAKISLVHAYQIPADIYPYTLYITEGMLEKIEETHQTRMNALRKHVEKRGIRVEGAVVRGESHDSIAKAAREQKADLIIMGTRGLTGLKHLALGSTAERTVRLAHCPVVTVPLPSEASV